MRASISSLALLSPVDAERGVRRLREDLESGAWDARFGHLRELPELDLGYRLVVAGNVGWHIPESAPFADWGHDQDG